MKILTALLLGTAVASAAGLRTANPQENFRAFALQTRISPGERTYAISSTSNLILGHPQFGLVGEWWIGRGVDADDRVELSADWTQFTSGTNILGERYVFALGLGREQRTSLNPLLTFEHGGMIQGRFLTSSSFKAADFSNLLAPAFRITGASNTPVVMTDAAARWQGGGLAVRYEATVRLLPGDLFMAELAAGIRAFLDVESYGGSTALPSLVGGYAAHARLRLALRYEMVEPWIEYRLDFLGGERNLIGTRDLAWPVTQWIGIGIRFRFSLLCFG